MEIQFYVFLLFIFHMKWRHRLALMAFAVVFTHQDRSSVPCTHKDLVRGGTWGPACYKTPFPSTPCVSPPPLHSCLSLCFGRVGVAAIPSSSLTTSAWSMMHTCVPSASSAAVWKTRPSILSLPGCWFNPNGSVDGPTPSVAVVWFAHVFPRCASGSHHHSSDSLSFLPSSTTPIRFSTPPLRTTINHSYLLTISLCQAPGFFLRTPLLTPHPSPLTSQHSGIDCCCHGMS